MINSILLFTILSPLVGVFIITAIPSSNINRLWSIGLWSSVICFISSIFLWVNFDYSISSYQFVNDYKWFNSIHLVMGIDGISLFFILLTTFLIPMCLISSVNSIQKKIKEYIICFLIMETCILCVFSFIDLFIFYIFFESVLIPMFVLISIWGSRERKIRASYLFFMFTLVGSLLMLFAIIYIYMLTGSTDIRFLSFYNFDT